MGAEIWTVTSAANDRMVVARHRPIHPTVSLLMRLTNDWVDDDSAGYCARGGNR